VQDADAEVVQTAHLEVVEEPAPEVPIDGLQTSTVMLVIAPLLVVVATAPVRCSNSKSAALGPVPGQGVELLHAGGYAVPPGLVGPVIAYSAAVLLAAVKLTVTKKK
jgi:hypothetical protein